MFGFLALLIACRDEPEATQPAATGLRGAALADRISLDLRGVHASAEEIASAEASDQNIESLINEYLNDQRFPSRVAWIWNDTLHTALWFDDYRRFGSLDFEDWRAMGQEPLRQIEAVVASGAPFSEILTSETLQADETLAAWWPLTREEGEGWTASTYTDGRPMAGLLSSASLWQRYNGDITNRNRGRANALARAFLCADFFDRDVQFDFALDAEDLEQMENAVREQESCLGCHAALDPLASFFGGFTERSQEEPQDQFTRWSPWTADWYAAWTRPAYYGHPGADLTDLGAFIAADPRFATCVVDRLYEGLVGEPLEDAALRAELGESFRASNLDARALVAEVLALDAYRRDEDRLLSPEQLGASLQDALGLDEGAALDDGLNPLTWSVEHRVLAGGGDDHTVLDRNRAPGLGVNAMQLWAARQGAAAALELDASRADGEQILWTLVDPYSESPSEADLRAQLRAWRIRLHGASIPEDDPGLDGLVALWQGAAASAGPARAWEHALAALVRHPDTVLY